MWTSIWVGKMPVTPVTSGTRVVPSNSQGLFAPSTPYRRRVSVPLVTGVTGIFPTQIEVHKNHLFVSYLGSLQNCGTGLPYQWTVLTGAAELGLGDTITGLMSVSGNEAQAALLVTCVNRFGALYGNDSTDFNMVPISLEAGCKPYSLEQLDRVLALDESGVRDFRPTQAFGNYHSTTLTAHIQKQATGLTPLAAVIDRERSRYRIFFSAGRVLTGTPGKRWSWLWSEYPVTANVAHEGEVSGASRMFIGGTDGMVYEIKDCRSFDGTEIEAWLKTSYTHLGSPGYRKAFRRFDVEARGQSAGTINFLADFSYGGADIAPAYTASGTVPSPPTQWDVDVWDSGEWDGQFSKTIRFRVPGIGENVSMTFHSLSDSQLPHELTGCNVTYLPRRQER